LRNEGIDTAKLYSRTPSKAKQYYGYTGDCPNTEKLADTVLTVPNYYSLSDKELLKVANCIKRVEKLL
jgi:dTDP-4-amino-4,6-dideoxygalactose transaminase